MKSLGYSVAAFPSAKDFLASPHLADTACLIADVQMPAVTGIELCALLIQGRQTIPTILITAYPDDKVRARVLSQGVIGYLPKPFRDEELLRCVHSALDRAEPLEDLS
jgi:FixJ family two-component response regulator